LEVWKVERFYLQGIGQDCWNTNKATDWLVSRGVSSSCKNTIVLLHVKKINAEILDYFYIEVKKILCGAVFIIFHENIFGLGWNGDNIPKGLERVRDTRLSVW